MKIATLYWMIPVFAFSFRSPDYDVPKQKIPAIFTEEFENSTLLKSDTSSTQICETRKIQYSIGGSETQLFDPASTFFFPGNVLEAEAFANGYFIPVQGERLPIRFSTSGNFNLLSALNNSPSDLSAAREAISTIIRSEKAGDAGANTIITCKEIYSEEHLKSYLRGNFSGNFASIKGMFNFDNQIIKSRFLLEISQIFYTIDCDYPGIGGFFRRKPDTNLNKSPLYVKSVSYGRKVVIAIETDENLHKREKDIKAEFDGFLTSGSLSAGLETQKLIRKQAISVTVIGGSSSLPFEVLGKINQRDSLMSVLTRTASWSSSNPGFPLKYAVHHCADDEIYKVGTTGDFQARVCLPKGEFERVYPAKNLRNLCAVPRTQNRQFTPGPIIFDFNIDYLIRGNAVVARITANWFENGGDFSEADLLFEDAVLIVPDSLVLMRVLSTNGANISGKRLPGFNKHNLTNYLNKKDIVKRLIVIGDIRDDDDPWVGDCSNKHMQIERLWLWPIKVSVTRNHQRSSRTKNTETDLGH